MRKRGQGGIMSAQLVGKRIFRQTLFAICVQPVIMVFFTKGLELIGYSFRE